MKEAHGSKARHMFSMFHYCAVFLILLKTSGSRFLNQRTFSISSFVFEKNQNLRASGSLAFYNQKNIQFWAFENFRKFGSSHERTSKGSAV
jgi:hypothetical protein